VQACRKFSLRIGRRRRLRGGSRGAESRQQPAQYTFVLTTVPQQLLPWMGARGWQMSPDLAGATTAAAAMSYRLRKEERGCDSNQMLQHAQAEIKEARGAHLYQRRHLACPGRLHAQDKLHSYRGVARFPLCSLPLILVLELERTEHVALENLHFHRPRQHSQALLRSLAPDTNLVLPCQARPINLPDILANETTPHLATLFGVANPWSRGQAQDQPCTRFDARVMTHVSHLRLPSTAILASSQLQ
jgi:hypothetical protein